MRTVICILLLCAASAIAADSVHFLNTADIEKPPAMPLDRAWANVASAALTSYAGKTGDVELLKASIDQCAAALEAYQKSITVEAK